MDNDKTNTKPSEMNPEDLPDVRAFHDEFTRGFLQSTEETRPGYYPFLSGTGAYKMDFPAGGVIGERAYAIKEKGYEEYPVHIENEDGTGSMININYYSYHKTENVDSYLDSLEHRLGENVDFKKINGDSQSVYYTNYEGDGFYTYAGYVQNKINNGGIKIIYNKDCRGELEKICKRNKQKDKEGIIQWMESIRFVNKDANSG
ncbi:hypothetical protein [Virgibacillus dakarensis]|uniref:hypothetical protein n=1 Tax=Virgibacillus dakarensis TaxID=1917889 RepID=UPI000B43FD77|nr:hypothetical protein [Virgibacillus dakarensis]